MVIEGNWALLSATSNFVAYDITDPDNPVHQTTFPIGSQNKGISWYSDHVYITNYPSNAVYVLDVVDPLNPAIVDTVDNAQPPGESLVDGTYLYVTGSSATNIYDLTDPAAPVYSADATGISYSIFIDGTDLFVAKDSNAMRIFDITDPLNATESAKFYPTGPANSIVIDGNYAFLGSNGIGDSSRVHILDISDPLNPVQVSTYKVNHGWAQELAISGDYLYSCQSQWLEIIDVSDKANPVQALLTQANGTTYDMVIEGNIAFVASGNHMRTFDLTDPVNPVQLRDGNYTYSIDAIAVSGSFAYLGLGSTAIRLVDASAPNNPFTVGTIYPPSRVYSLAAVNNKLYVGTNSDGLMIYDVSDPTTPVFLGDITTGARVYDIQVEGNAAFCSVYDAGLRVYDVSDPAAIVESGYYDRGILEAWETVVSGSYAFTAFQSDMSVFDISLVAGVNYPPDSFSLLTPADGSTHTTADVDLTWETATDAEDAVTYDVEISDDGGTTWNTEATGLATTNYTFAASPGVDYQWRVQAQDGENTTESTETWSFESLTGFSVSAFISANIQDTGIYGFLDDAATDDYDIGVDVPEPANPADSYLTVYFDHDDWDPLPSRWLYDYRLPDDLTTTRENFHFNCRTDQVGQEVTLTFTLNTANDLPTFLFDGTRYYDLTGLATYDHNFTPAVMDQDYGFVVIFGESTAPVLDVTYPTADITLDTETEYTVTFTTQDELPILDATVYYSMDDGVSWVEIATINNALDDTTNLVQSGTNSQAWTTPNEFYSYTLIRVVANDFAGNTGETITAYTFNVAPSTMAQDYNPGWYMFGLPMLPNDLTISSIYGSFTNYFFLYDYTQATDYIFLDAADELEFPRGYWMYLTGVATETLTLDGANSAPQVDGTSLDLNEGWNVIGSGLPAEFQRDSLSFTDGVDTWSWADAVTNGWIANALFDYDEVTDAYALSTSMFAREGYWLYTSVAGITMNVVPMHNGGTIILNDEDEEGWFVPLTLSQNDRVENIAGFGMHPDASVEFDQLDVPAPPTSPTDEYLRVSFNHTEWEGIRKLSREVVAESDQYQFELTIESSETGMVTLNFNDIANLLPDGFEANATFNGSTFNLIEHAEITFDYADVTAIQVTVGASLNAIDDLATSLPAEFAITSIYPNPFNPSTEISVALPQSAELNIHLYNVIGEKVMDVFNGRTEAGIQTFTLNANGFSNGVYFVRVSAPGQFSQIRKIVLVK
ncbi:T9SS type A sorting domain-containing protein [bacterium]|nr:T9SS type A sorting domain-containing protein [bacterium]